MNYETIDVSSKDSIFSIWLNRPDVLNSFNELMSAELIAALKAAGEKESCRVIALRGKGKAFSAGQDLGELDLSSSARADQVRRILAEGLNPIARIISELPQPVVAAVNGVAAGAGASLAFASDITIASDRAKFILAFVQVALIPDGGATYFLPRLVGPARARFLAMTGKTVDAEEALEIGLVSSVVSEGDFERELQELLTALASKPPGALSLIKQALNKSISNSLEEQLLLEERLQVEAAGAEDYVEGVQAFLEKRRPNFTGK